MFQILAHKARVDADFFLGKYNRNSQIISPDICIYFPWVVYYKLGIVIS